MGRGLRLSVLLIAVFVVLCAISGTTPTWAQNNRYTDRSFVSSPVVLGMGDAGVGLPGPERSFFFNPAHLPAVSSQFTILGVQGATSLSLPDQIEFLNRRVEPAAEKSFRISPDALSNLYEAARNLGDRPGRGHGAVLLPSFVYSKGALGVAGGVYSKTALNYRIEAGAAQIPEIWLVSRTDVMALASMGLNLRNVGLRQVSLGVTGTQTRRFLAFKNKPIDRLRDDEPAVLLDGSTFQMDVGVVYTPTWFSGVPGTVRFGGAVYDILDQGYGYTSGGGAGRMPFVDDLVGRPEDGQSPRLAPERRRAHQRFALRTSYRLGAAYQISEISFMDDVALAVDYQGYGPGSQAPLARVHTGVRAQVVGPLELRAGMSGGYPSGGLGARWGALEADYAVHGVEEGRKPGQLGTYIHTARLLLRLQ